MAALCNLLACPQDRNQRCFACPNGGPDRTALLPSQLALLRRADALLRRWTELYGQHNPQWLPPAGIVQWHEDAALFVAAPVVPLDGDGVLVPHGKTD